MPGPGTLVRHFLAVVGRRPSAPGLLRTLHPLTVVACSFPDVAVHLFSLSAAPTIEAPLAAVRRRIGHARTTLVAGTRLRFEQTPRPHRLRGVAGGRYRFRVRFNIADGRRVNIDEDEIVLHEDSETVVWLRAVSAGESLQDADVLLMLARRTHPKRRRTLPGSAGEGFWNGPTQRLRLRRTSGTTRQRVEDSRPPSSTTCERRPGSSS